MKHPVVLSLGEVLWDLFPDGERFGGAPANFACHAAMAGAHVIMVSAVGDDARGRAAAEFLDGHGIDVQLLQVILDAPTGTVGVDLDHGGKPTFTIHENSAWDRLQWTDSLQEAVRNSDAIYYGTLGQRSPQSRETIRRAAELAKQLEIPRIVDINLRAPFFDDGGIRKSIELASVLKLSDDELAQIASALELSPSDDEQMLRQILDTGSLDLVVMTRGADGATLVSRTEVLHQPGFPVTVCDTVGAGDAFTATLIHGLLHGDELARILRQACERSAAVCTQPGAVPSV